MVGSSSRRSTLNAPLAFAASALIVLTELLLHPTIVLVFFVSQLTDSLRTIGFVVTVGLLGWYIPQVITPWIARPSSRQMPWALGASLVRAASVIFLAYVGYRTDVSDDERLRSFFICYVAYAVASGFAQPPTNELIARGLRGGQLGWFLAQRNLWSGLLALVAGIVARESLGPSGPGFPRNVTLLFIAAAAAISGATFFLARIREAPVAEQAGDRPRVRDIRAAFADGALRRFALFGCVAGFATVADAFVVIYARREFGLPSDMIGTFLVVFAAASLLTAPLWSLLLRTGGARASIQTATALKVIAPLVLLFVPYALDTELYRDNVENDRVAFYLLAVPFAIQGLALRGFIGGNFRYVLEITVPERRVVYQMVALTPLLPAAAAPLIGAWIVDRWSFERLFLIAVFAGLISILAGGLLANTSLRVSAPTRAWRLRDARP